MIRSGRLRHRVALQQPTTTRNSTGEPIVTWTTVATVWAEVLDLRGREYIASQEAHSEVGTKITIRYRSDLDLTWRAVFGTRLFDIQQIADLKGHNAILELMCREIR